LGVHQDVLHVRQRLHLLGCALRVQTF
jgi:hypothetical protein